MEIEVKTKTTDHPLEEVFGIESGTTVIEYKEVVPQEPIPAPQYDEKDDGIEQQLEEIYATAMTQVTTMGDEVVKVEGKYKARIGEVTATMLNVALGAVSEKRRMKEHKDKLTSTEKAGPQTVNNNLVVTDRNEILRLLEGKTTIDG